MADVPVGNKDDSDKAYLLRLATVGKEETLATIDPEKYLATMNPQRPYVPILEPCSEGADEKNPPETQPRPWSSLLVFRGRRRIYWLAVLIGLALWIGFGPLAQVASEAPNGLHRWLDRFNCHPVQKLQSLLGKVDVPLKEEFPFTAKERFWEVPFRINRVAEQKLEMAKFQSEPAMIEIPTSKWELLSIHVVGGDVRVRLVRSDSVKAVLEWEDTPPSGKFKRVGGSTSAVIDATGTNSTLVVYYPGPEAFSGRPQMLYLSGPAFSFEPTPADVMYEVLRVRAERLVAPDIVAMANLEVESVNVEGTFTGGAVNLRATGTLNATVKSTGPSLRVVGYANGDVNLSVPDMTAPTSIFIISRSAINIDHPTGGHGSFEAESHSGTITLGVKDPKFPLDITRRYSKGKGLVMEGRTRPIDLDEPVPPEVPPEDADRYRRRVLHRVHAWALNGAIHLEV